MLPSIANLMEMIEQALAISTPSSSSTDSPIPESSVSSRSRSSSPTMLPAPTRDSSSDSGAKLSEVLNVLDFEDEANIFIVRRISKLGYGAHDSLSQFFGLFGSIRRVLLLPSRGRGDSRVRPASMGFIVMDAAADCARICSAETYTVNGVNVQVQKFARNTRVEVSDGATVTNAYIPAVPKQDSPTVTLPRHLTISEVEILARAMIDTLQL